MTAVFTALISLFVSSPPVFVASIFTLLFAHVGLVSDPPNISDSPSLVSLLISRFLPAAFTAAVLYRFSARKALRDLDPAAAGEKTVLWLGGAWLGALNNLTFDWIPIARLTPRDVGAQPGGVLALVIIVLLLFTIALGQAHYFRLEGRFRRNLALYLGIGAVLLVCVAIPGLHLRIHHYVLAILLLPGTALQTRPSLLYQGLLFGLFINGVARWGFASVLETGPALYGSGEADIGPVFPNVTRDFLWPPPGWGVPPTALRLAWSTPLPGAWDGLSILINDVERERWYEDMGRPPRFEWVLSEDKPDYTRVAYMSGSRTGTFTPGRLW